MTTDLRALVRDLMPALDAYEMAGRRSYYKDGVLHWEMTAQYWDAQRLRERVEAALDAQAGMVMVPVPELEFLRDCSDSDMQDGDLARQLASYWLYQAGPVEGGE